jgi:hypothetical protein
MAQTIQFGSAWDGKASTIPSPYYAEFTLSATNGDLQVNFDSPFFGDPAPPFEKGKVEGLHDYEVVELFISGFPYGSDEKDVPYLEIQLGPHGHYFISFFMREADWAGQDTSIEFIDPPIIDIMYTTKRWKAGIKIPSYYLPEPICGENYSVQWRINLCAIHALEINNNNNQVLTREYISYVNFPPSTTPNFHQLKYFTPIILYETLEVRSLVDRTKSIVHDKLSLTPTTKGNQTTVFSLTDQLRNAVLTEGVQDSDHDYHNTTTHNTNNTNNNQTKKLPALSTIDEDEISESRASTVPVSIHSTSMASTTINTTNTTNTTPTNPQTMSEAPFPTIDEVGKQIRDQLLRSNVQLTDLEEQFQRNILKDEFVILHSIVWKRRGFSYKKRKLILTSAPRLIYLTLEGEYKGTIQWTMTKRIKVIVVNEEKFDITLDDNSRTYHFNDALLGSNVWIDALQQILIAQKQYLTASRRT